MFLLFPFLSMILPPSKPSSPPSSALVPYTTHSAPLSRFRETTRRVTVGETTVTLEQDWDEHGVAGVLWDSAIVLSKYLLSPESDIDINGKCLVELGSGLGLPSILLSLSSLPTRVIATEQSLGLPLLQRNVLLNNAPVQIEHLDWSSPSSSPVSSLSFDVILGADLVYKEEAFPLLHQTLRVLANKNTVIVLASRIRYPKDRKFYSNLKNDGFSVERILYDRDTDVFLYRIQKQE